MRIRCGDRLLHGLDDRPRMQRRDERERGAGAASSSSAFVLVAAQLDSRATAFSSTGCPAPRPSPSDRGCMCMAAPRQRAGVRNSAGRSRAVRRLDHARLERLRRRQPEHARRTLQPGELVWFQTWWRSPASPGGTALSAALQPAFRSISRLGSACRLFRHMRILLVSTASCPRTRRARRCTRAALRSRSPRADTRSTC